MNYTVDECREMIALYIEAEKAVLTGKRYRIGTRELERVDLNEIQAGRSKWERLLESALNGGRRRKIKAIIPRDL